MLEGDPNKFIPRGSIVDGFLDADVQWLRERSKNNEEMYKNTINLWLWKNPKNIQDLIDVLNINKERRAKSNPSGMNKTKTFGTGISLPSTLYIALNKVDPELFSDKKKLNKFKSWFPQFKTY